MKRMLGCIVVCLVGVAAATSAQRGSESNRPDPYDGHWRLNPSKTKMFGRAPTTFEDITIWTKNGVQDYSLEVSSGVGGAPNIRPSECTAAKPTPGDTCLSRTHYVNRYNDFTWSPRLSLTFGTIGGEHITMKVDDRTHYRFTRRPNGEFSDVMMRRLTEDLKEYVAVIFNPDGEVTLHRWFTRLENGVLVKPYGQ